jgi:hypothetical protein
MYSDLVHRVYQQFFFLQNALLFLQRPCKCNFTHALNICMALYLQIFRKLKCLTALRAGHLYGISPTSEVNGEYMDRNPFICKEQKCEKNIIYALV